MAFKPNPNFKTAPITLYVASWGPDKWVTHDYEYEREDGVGHDIQPLVFQYSEQKFCNDQNGKEIRYAYHIPPHGKKHGVEHLINNKGETAKLWNAKTMVKALCEVITKRYGIKETPTIFFGKTTNNRNDAFGRYTCGLTIAVHIARPDAEDPADAEIGAIWYSLQNGKEIPKCFDMSCKEGFVKICGDILKKYK